MVAPRPQPQYYLPKKAIKGDCPQCSPRHRRTLSRFVDRDINEVLPEAFGRCDRESNCGYYLSPYHKTASGLSYADEQKGPPLTKEWFSLAGKWKHQQITRQGVVLALVKKGATPDQAKRVTAYIFDKPEPQQPTPPPIYSLPDEVLTKSLSHYERNEFARFLSGRFGNEVADQLLKRFQVGTSAHWDGACVFWLIDEQNRVRGGQICLYDQTGHKAKYIDKEGKERACISSVRAALKWKYKGLEPPDWLAEDAETWPVPFGLPQLQTSMADMPVALVEGPKTAIICSHLHPEFIWLAIGGKSYLKAERLAALRGRKIMLYPDLNAYYDTTNDKGHKTKGWLTMAQQLMAEGFNVTVSDVLELWATDEDREEGGLDLADFLLRETNTTTEFSEVQPDQVVQFDQSHIEQPTVPTNDHYQPELNVLQSHEPPVTIRAQTVDEPFIIIRGIRYKISGLIFEAERMHRKYWQYLSNPPQVWNRP